MNKKKIIVSAVTLLLSIVAIIFGINYTDEDVNKISDGVETVVNIVEEKQVVEIPKLEQEDEQTLEVQETDIENQGFERQGEVAYNGSDKTPKINVGKYKGLTYYSQVDSKWKNYKYS